jgi:hypothetical protein
MSLFKRILMYFRRRPTIAELTPMQRVLWLSIRRAK